MRAAIGPLKRFLATVEVAKHRLFRWVESGILPSGSLVVIARDDDVSLGILQSIFHTTWATTISNELEDRPRYNHSRCYETFPFPDGLTPDVSSELFSANGIAEEIARGAKNLDQLRENWLNPSDLVERAPEVVPGYPDRILPKSQAAAEQLKKRTLTNLYNKRPTWLAHAHRELDRAVAIAYGWPETLADRAQPENPDVADRKAAEEEVLKRLFDLNQERAKAGR